MGRERWLTPDCFVRQAFHPCVMLLVEELCYRYPFVYGESVFKRVFFSVWNERKSGLGCLPCLCRRRLRENSLVILHARRMHEVFWRIVNSFKAKCFPSPLILNLLYDLSVFMLPIYGILLFIRLLFFYPNWQSSSCLRAYLYLYFGVTQISVIMGKAEYDTIAFLSGKGFDSVSCPVPNFDVIKNSRSRLVIHRITMMKWMQTKWMWHMIRMGCTWGFHFCLFRSWQRSLFCLVLRGWTRWWFYPLLVFVWVFFLFILTMRVRILFVLFAKE